MSHPLRIRLVRSRCPFCHGLVGAEDTKTGCEGCTAWHHRECWESHGRCSACGFAREPQPTDPPCTWPGGCASPSNETIYEILDERFCARHGKREVEKTVRFALPYGIVVCLVAAACTVAAYTRGTFFEPATFDLRCVLLACGFWICGLGLTTSSLVGYFRVRRRL